MESAKKVLVGLVMGVVFGLALHTFMVLTARYLKILYSGLTSLVRLCSTAANDRYAVSLRLYSGAVARLHNASQLGKISFLTIVRFCLPR